MNEVDETMGTMIFIDVRNIVLLSSNMPSRRQNKRQYIIRDGNKVKIGHTMDAEVANSHTHWWLRDSKNPLSAIGPLPHCSRYCSRRQTIEMDKD